MDGSTVLRFVRAGLAAGLCDAIGGPVGLTPDALCPDEPATWRAGSLVRAALSRERRVGGRGPVQEFVNAGAAYWVAVDYGEAETRMASALRSRQMNDVDLGGSWGAGTRGAQWLGAGNSEALAVAHLQDIPLLTCCALTLAVARRFTPETELVDGALVMASLDRRREAS
ncbi:MAG: hypothetical protein AAGK21_15700 [Bacteroidota bacterium]